MCVHRMLTEYRRHGPVFFKVTQLGKLGLARLSSQPESRIVQTLERKTRLWNINQDEKKALTLRKCLILLHSLAERTGLEPATPGVTGPLSKSMFMRVSSQIVFQKVSKTCRFHAGLQTFIPNF